MSYTVVLRHSHRSKIRNADDAIKARITLRGYAYALRAGAFLRKKLPDIESIHSSNASRCYRTAQAVRAAYRAFNYPKVLREARPCDFFGAGYIREEKFCAWLEDTKNRARGRSTGPDSFYERFRIWEESDLLRCGIEQYGKEFLSRFLSDRNLLFITHNSTITPIMEFLSRKHEFEVRPAFLDPEVLSGFCIYHSFGSPESIYWIERAAEMQLVWQLRQ